MLLLRRSVTLAIGFSLVWSGIDAAKYCLAWEMGNAGEVEIWIGTVQQQRPRLQAADAPRLMYAGQAEAAKPIGEVQPVVSTDEIVTAPAVDEDEFQAPLPELSNSPQTTPEGPSVPPSHAESTSSRKRNYTLQVDSAMAMPPVAATVPLQNVNTAPPRVAVIAPPPVASIAPPPVAALTPPPVAAIAPVQTGTSSIDRIPEMAEAQALLDESIALAEEAKRLLKTMAGSERSSFSAVPPVSNESFEWTKTGGDNLKWQGIPIRRRAVPAAEPQREDTSVPSTSESSRGSRSSSDTTAPLWAPKNDLDTPPVQLSPVDPWLGNGADSQTFDTESSCGLATQLSSSSGQTPWLNPENLPVLICLLLIAVALRWSPSFGNKVVAD